jgi:cyclic pyranopterin phosphate synthase
MPEEGLTWLPKDEVLTFEELERVASLLVHRHGIRSIRLTGGEPTVRAHLPVLVAKLADLPIDLALTTNGATLRTVAPALADAGLRRVNVSLDSLRPERFAELTRRDQLGDVLDGIDAAVTAGLAPVKVNVVVVRGVNDDEILDLAAYGRQRAVTVRFIEWMPLDASDAWTNDQVVTQAEIVDLIGAVYPLEPIVRGSEPAERFRYLDGAGEVGVIPSVTRPFCEQCDRIRLTADGQLRSCLFSLVDHDLRGVLRGGGSDDDLSDAIEACVSAKWAGHAINQVQFVKPRRSMSQIGG